MKKGFILFMVAVLCFNISACSKMMITEKRGDDSVISVESEDEEMNRIIDKARQTVSDFVTELNNPNTKGVDFTVKYPFTTDPGSENSVEHIWLVNIEVSNNKYYGIVANDPFYIKSMKLGDRVEIDINMVSDWKYVLDGYLVGGESIVYFYNRMSEQEKKDFEKEAGFKIRNK